MRAFPARFLHFVAVAVLLNSALACPDIKLFLGSCSLQSAGRVVAREQAFEKLSESFKEKDLVELTDGATKYFDFDVEAFQEACELPFDEFCDFLKCDCTEPVVRDDFSIVCLPDSGCTATLPVPEFRRNDANLESLPPASPVCLPGMKCTVDPAAPEEGTILGLCTGTKCTGFLSASQAVNSLRLEQCGEAPDSCPSAPASCEGDILESCCIHPKGETFCFCRTCTPPVLLHRKKNSSGKTRVSDPKGSKCECP